MPAGGVPQQFLGGRDVYTLEPQHGCERVPKSVETDLLDDPEFQERRSDQKFPSSQPFFSVNLSLEKAR